MATPTSIAVVTPNGGESFRNGDTIDISWTLDSQADEGEFQVWLVDSDDNWVIALGQVDAVAGATWYSYKWTVSAPPRDDYVLDVLFRVDTQYWVFDPWDISDAVFEIVGPQFLMKMNTPTNVPTASLRKHRFPLRGERSSERLNLALLSIEGDLKVLHRELVDLKYIATSGQDIYVDTPVPSVIGGG